MDMANKHIVDLVSHGEYSISINYFSWQDSVYQETTTNCIARGFPRGPIRDSLSIPLSNRKSAEMKRGDNKTNAFVTQIESLRFKNAFNPYAEICDLCDRPNAAELRRQNLRKVLHAAVENGVESVWIARDLGYRGGRRTGLALTDEVHLQSHSKLLKSAPLHQATKGPAVGERTALIVWRMLNLINAPVFLWNIFPLHPHEPNEPLSNRTHNRAERSACAPCCFGYCNI